MQRNDDPVAQILGLHAAEGFVTFMVRNKVLQSVLTAFEGGFMDIGDQPDLSLNAVSVGLGVGFVDIDHDLVGLVQFIHHDAHIVHQKGEAAHDQQAGHRHENGGEGHETVGKDATDALFK